MLRFFINRSKIATTLREWKLLQGCLRKGSGIMEELASELLKELNCDTAFSIKLPAGLPLIGGVQLDIA